MSKYGSSCMDLPHRILPLFLFASILHYTEALDAVIVEDVRACQPHPPFPASVKDGYAVIGMYAWL